MAPMTEDLPPPPADHLASILNALDEEETLPPEYISLVSWFAFHEAVHMPDMAADQADITSVAILDETEFEKEDGFRILGFTAEHGPIYQRMISSLLDAHHYVLIGMEPDGKTPRYGALNVEIKQTPEEREALYQLMFLETRQKLAKQDQLADNWLAVCEKENPFPEA